MSSPALSSWEAHVEDESGATFYHNTVTGVSQWEPPEGWEQRRRAEGAATDEAAGSEARGGLSALAKRLREMQRSSAEQASEIERLERRARSQTVGPPPSPAVREMPWREA